MTVRKSRVTRQLADGERSGGTRFHVPRPAPDLDGLSPHEADELLATVDPAWALTGDRAADLADVVVEDVWIEAGLGAWTAAFRIVGDSRGAPVIGEVRLFPHEHRRPGGWKGKWSAEVLGYQAMAPEGGITARLWRTLPIGQRAKFLRRIIEIYRRERAWDLAEFGRIVRPIIRDGAGPWLATSVDAPRRSRTRSVPASGKRPGRKPTPDIKLAELARDYCKLGTRLAVARKWKISEAAARNRIYEARLRGFLPVTTEGFGGLLVLPDKAKKLLAEKVERPEKDRSANLPPKSRKH